MDLTKAIELLEKSEHIGIFLAKDASFDALAAAEVLARTLEDLDKKIGLLTDNAAVKNIPFRILAAAAPLPKEFVISIGASSAPVAQLRYEKTEDGIDIILSPKSLPIVKDALNFRDGKTICDCVLAVGMPNFESLSNIPGLAPDFFTETPIINVDIKARNDQYGEVNLVDERRASLAEIAYELSTALSGSPPDADTATLILAGVVAQTDGFRSAATTPDALLASSELMRCGAKMPAAFSLAGGFLPPNVLQLAGRASARSRLDEASGILWSLATAEDFEKTAASPSDTNKVLSHLASSFPLHRLTALLWQDPGKKDIHATLSGEKEFLEEVRTRLGGEFRSPYLELAPSYPSFGAAEDTLTRMLEELFQKVD